jgi:hypothetical protein
VSTEVVPIQKLYYSCVYWSGAYTEAVLLVCILEWCVYRSCITRVYTGVMLIQKLYYSGVYWSGAYTEVVCIQKLYYSCVNWSVYRRCITPVYTEVVGIQKLSQRREEPVRRLLCLTEATLVERDPATYNLITLRPLSMVAALVRPKEKETKQFIFIRLPYFFMLL